jgi:hypothetical protein
MSRIRERKTLLQNLTRHRSAKASQPSFGAISHPGLQTDWQPAPAPPGATIYASSAYGLPLTWLAPEIRSKGAKGYSSRELRGDVEAFYDLVRPYERAVFLAALSLVKKDADGEEVTQEAILKALRISPASARRPSSAPG